MSLDDKIAVLVRDFIAGTYKFVGYRKRTSNLLRAIRCQIGEEEKSWSQQNLFIHSSSEKKLL